MGFLSFGGKKKPRPSRQDELLEILHCPEGTSLRVTPIVGFWSPSNLDWSSFLAQQEVGTYMKDVCEAFSEQHDSYIQGYIEAPPATKYTSRVFANANTKDLGEISRNCRFKIRSLGKKAKTAMRLDAGDDGTEVVFENATFEFTYTPHGTHNELVACLPRVPKLTILPSGCFVFGT